MTNEVVVYRTQLHWIIFAPSALLLLFTIFSWVFILISALTMVSALIAYYSSEFAITNKRIIIKIGFIQRSSFEILLSKVEGISVDQTIPGRLFDYGTITVTGTGGSKEPFRTIDSPLEFRKKAQEQIAAIQG
jgi:uncharacterized membrane protein YdbT with pleckstrin-like domain